MKGSKNRLTLLELLGAFIILSVVGILDTSLLQQTSAVFRDGNKHTDNFALARISLYLIKQDLGFAVLRSDLIQLPDSADGGSRPSFWLNDAGWVRH